MMAEPVVVAVIVNGVPGAGRRSKVKREDRATLENTLWNLGFTMAANVRAPVAPATIAAFASTVVTHGHSWFVSYVQLAKLPEQ